MAKFISSEFWFSLFWTPAVDPKINWNTSHEELVRKTVGTGGKYDDDCAQDLYQVEEVQVQRPQDHRQRCLQVMDSSRIMICLTLFLWA